MSDWKPVSEMTSPYQQADPALGRLLTDRQRASRLTHVRTLPARDGSLADWPGWVPAALVRRLADAGIPRPWRHQVIAADHAHAGRSVIIATGTASGKSLGYLLPAISGIIEGAHALYIAPTKALAGDQLRAIAALGVPEVRAAKVDGDTGPADRRWARTHANLVLTNPDMLHHSLLPGHVRWSGFWRRLCYVVIDECHGYRGVFGSHVAQVIRRLRRICARYGAHPVFVLASATAAEPETAAQRLTGVPVVPVVDDHAPRGATTFALWEPALSHLVGEHGAPIRRTATAEAADLLADLVADKVRTLAFVRSRRGAEAVAMNTRRVLGETGRADLADRIAAYRAGYLADDRRDLEQALSDGRLIGLAATNALELGIDVSGLDAVLIAGWPGTLASLWQQAGRAGRDGQPALAIYLAGDDPLDTYLVHHPESIFGRPVEATVLDPDNPYVLEPHLCAAAAELPITGADLELFGPAAAEAVTALTTQNLLRHRPTGWYWTRRDRPSSLVDLRGAGGAPVQIVERGTGELIGTVDEPAADTTLHEGAVYLHQGDTFLVESLDLADATALVRRCRPDYVTFARQVTGIRVLDVGDARGSGATRLCFGSVEVTRQVVGYLMRRPQTGEVLGERRLDLPPRTLRTRAVWWCVDDERLAALHVTDAELAGAAHAAEHASIGMLPLLATCDRSDIGGVSTRLHADTGRLTVFVYDGNEGGAGFAERGFHDAHRWLTATRAAVLSCGCEAGCPSCVQSPKCGTGNEPLDKATAIDLLTLLLDDLP